MRPGAFGHHGQGFAPILLRIRGLLRQGWQLCDTRAQRAAGQVNGLVLAIKSAFARFQAGEPF